MTGFDSKRSAAQDKMELADAYASAVAATPNLPTPLERKLAVERIERARNALEAALEQQQDKLTDDAQGYIAQYKAALLLPYQSGFADGKMSAQRKPLTDDVLVPLKVLEAVEDSLDSFCGNLGWGDADLQNMDNISALIAQHKAAHNIKEQP